MDKVCAFFSFKTNQAQQKKVMRLRWKGKINDDIKVFYAFTHSILPGKMFKQLFLGGGIWTN